MNHRDELKQIRQMEKTTKRKNKEAQKARAEENPSKVAKFFKNRKVRITLIVFATIIFASSVAYKIADTIRFNSLPLFEKAIEIYEEDLEPEHNSLDGVELLHSFIPSNGLKVYLYTSTKDFNFNYCAMVLAENATGVYRYHINHRFGEYDCQIFFNDDFPCTVSTMSIVPVQTGREAIIIISLPWRNDGVDLMTSYTDHPLYGLAPYDTLGSEITAHYPSPTDNPCSAIPIWVLALPCDDLPDDYELRYGDFVLTAEDIRSGTWSPSANGN